jgi:hypothetical protein
MFMQMPTLIAAPAKLAPAATVSILSDQSLEIDDRDRPRGASCQLARRLSSWFSAPFCGSI